MTPSARPPERLPEGELFTEYIELLEDDTSPGTGYDRAKRDERRARLLAEIGERLETLEAVKSLIDEPDANTSQQRTTSGQPSNLSHHVATSDE